MVALAGISVEEQGGNPPQGATVDPSNEEHLSDSSRNDESVNNPIDADQTDNALSGLLGGAEGKDAAGSRFAGKNKYQCSTGLCGRKLKTRRDGGQGRKS